MLEAPTNLLVDIDLENRKWVLATVEETEQEVMSVMAHRTLIQFQREIQPENMYEPLTKEEVTQLLRNLERAWVAEMTRERQQVPL